MKLLHASSREREEQKQSGDQAKEKTIFFGLWIKNRFSSLFIRCHQLLALHNHPTPCHLFSYDKQGKFAFMLAFCTGYGCFSLRRKETRVQQKKVPHGKMKAFLRNMENEEKPLDKKKIKLSFLFPRKKCYFDEVYFFLSGFFVIVFRSPCRSLACFLHMGKFSANVSSVYKVHNFFSAKNKNWELLNWRSSKQTKKPAKLLHFFPLCTLFSLC